ncbi:MAG: DUF6340 family protein [Dysgonamonadaceae bacterium]|jgi:hypothetical protein|nr:DUF6340 family protein [Dysgonamonadaceae bacterium]
MKARLKEWLAGALLLTVTACSGIYPLAIEVLEPAPTALPGKVDHIIVVNNTAPQPNDIGVRRIYNDTLVSNYALDLDSMSLITVEALCTTIEAAHFFDNISLYRHPVRKDKEWMTGIPLPETFKDELFDVYDFDAVISIDRLLFALEEEVKTNAIELSGNYLSVFVSNKVKAALLCTIYPSEKREPGISFALSDSIVDKNTLVTNALTFLKTLPESLIEELAYRMGEKIASRILPVWTTQERIIYTGSHSRMKEAFSYSRRGKWEQAESLWLDLFDRESRNTGKAKLANNIAIANEMQDKLATAQHWAEKAKEYFPADTEEKTWANEYVSLLQQRIQNNRILDMQGSGEH